MNKIKRYLIWFFWVIYYLPSRFIMFRGWYLQDYIRYLNRVRKPWYKFKPSIRYHDPNKKYPSLGRYDIYLHGADDRFFTNRMNLDVDVYVSMDTGKLVGLRLYDENIEKDYRK